jgi:hypothetical protein
MKFFRVTLAIAALMAKCTHCYSQGFSNLNFESAYNLPGNPPEPNGASVAVTNALPAWAAYDGSLALSDVYYVSNYFYGNASAVELIGGSSALSGNFSAELFDESSIGQTGSVPGNAESLIFDAEGPGHDGSLAAAGFSVTLGGQILSYSAISTGSDCTVYGANIPADMIGQTEALDSIRQGGGSGQVLLDNIEFSPMSVPEPSEWGLIGLGTVLLRFCRRRKSG